MQTGSGLTMNAPVMLPPAVTVPQPPQSMPVPYTYTYPNGPVYVPSTTGQGGANNIVPFTPRAQTPDAFVNRPKPASVAETKPETPALPATLQLDENQTISIKEPHPFRRYVNNSLSIATGINLSLLSVLGVVGVAALVNKEVRSILATKWDVMKIENELTSKNLAAYHKAQNHKQEAAQTPPVDMDVEIDETTHKLKNFVYTLDDVHGQGKDFDEFKNLIRSIPELKAKNLLNAIPRGIILTGPPGTGKSFTAKCLANECQGAYLQFNGAELTKEYFGENSIMSMYRQAKELADKQGACIVYIDEAESFLRNNSDDMKAMLSLMDGPESNPNIMFVASTNLPISHMNEAITRSGRFSTQIEFKLPDKKGREKILEQNMTEMMTDKELELNPSIKLSTLASKTEGFSGADLKELINRAIVQSVSDKTTDQITMKHFDAGIQAIKKTRQNGRRTSFDFEN